MKVIDLLNMISKGEEVPKKIKYDYNEWEYDENLKTYYCGTCTLLNKYKYIYLNEEVEILEEDKKIEKIRQLCEYPNTDTYECWSVKEDILVDKINEIIDYLNKGEKND